MFPLSTYFKKIIQSLFQNTSEKQPKKREEDIFQKFCITSQHFSTSEKQQLYLENLQGNIQSTCPFRKKFITESDGPFLTRLQQLDIATYLPGDILTKVDVCSMAHSVEVRTPFLDHVFMEKIARMPCCHKLAQENSSSFLHARTKKILRDLAEPRLGSSVVSRPKKGFGIPMDAWFRGPWNAEVSKKLLFSETLPLFFQKTRVKELLEQHSAGQNQSTRLWNLLVLEEWLSTHKGRLKNL